MNHWAGLTFIADFLEAPYKVASSFLIRELTQRREGQKKYIRRYLNDKIKGWMSSTLRQSVAKVLETLYRILA